MEIQTKKELDTDLIAITDRIVVRIEEEESVRESGLFLPDQAKEIPHKGIVLTAGPECWKKGIDKGDRIIFVKWGGAKIRWNEEILIVMDINDVLAKITN